MNMLDDELFKRAQELEKIIKQINKLTSNAAKGRLKTSTCRGYFQYRIFQDKNDKRGKYVNKKNISRARSIAQRDYLMKIKKEAELELKTIYDLQSSRIDTIETLYNRQVRARQILTTPLVLSNEDYARKWQEKEFHHKYEDSAGGIYVSYKGEKMRSKSELIIANLLYLLNIPYHYEYPLVLLNGGTIYVDFLILDVRNRKEIWYEHFGMMGDMHYADKNIARFNELVAAGLIPKENFIATFETYNNPLDTRTLFRILEPYSNIKDYIDINKIVEAAARNY